MNSPTKEEIERVRESMNDVYIPESYAVIAWDAYMEAVEALLEVYSSPMYDPWQMQDERVDYVDVQVDKNTLEEIKAIVEKAPGEHQ